MTDLLKEIHDEIRQERAQKLWFSFGKIMLGVSVGVIIFTVILVRLESHGRNVSMDRTTQLIQGFKRLQVENYEKAHSAFSQLAGDESSPIFALALLQKAYTQQLQHDEAGALKTYQRLAKYKDENIKAFSRLAALKVAELSAETIVPELSSPFHASETEWKAWQLMAQGKTAEAAELFLTLSSDVEIPASLRARAGLALSHIAPEKLTISDSK